MGKNVFEDLGFSPEEAAALKLKSDLTLQGREACSPVLAKATANHPG
jgi:hypothetical protein